MLIFNKSVYPFYTATEIVADFSSTNLNKTSFFFFLSFDSTIDLARRRSNEFYLLFSIKRRKGEEIGKKSGVQSNNICSPDRVYDVPHGILDISPVGARSQRGHPYTVPCRSCADMAITWGSCTGPGISRTLAVVRTAPCLPATHVKKKGKKRVLFSVLVVSFHSLNVIHDGKR